MTDRVGRPPFLRGGADQQELRQLPPHAGVCGNPALRNSFRRRSGSACRGKSCFNFTTVEPGQLKELAAVTKKGIAGFKNLQPPWA